MQKWTGRFRHEPNRLTAASTPRTARSPPPRCPHLHALRAHTPALSAPPRCPHLRWQGRSKESLDWRFCPCEISRAKSREISRAKSRDFTRSSRAKFRVRNRAISRAKLRQIFARGISPHLRARYARSLRSPDTLFDFAQIGHFIGVRVDTLAPTPHDITAPDTRTCRPSIRLCAAPDTL